MGPRRSFSNSLTKQALDVGVLVLLTATVAEILHRRVVSRNIPTVEPLSVVVLGFPSWKSGRPHPVQRWRVGLLLDTVAKYNVTQIVFSGGSTSGPLSEASTMANLAQRLNPNLGSVVLENRSNSTWENVVYSSVLVHEDNGIVIVSDPLHAARARRYWADQNPHDIGRLYVTDCGKALGGWWIKTPSVLAEVLRTVKVRFVNRPAVDPLVEVPTGDTSQAC